MEQEGVKTWKFYRYSLIMVYKATPMLPPPLIVISLTRRTIYYLYSLCHKTCCS